MLIFKSHFPRLRSLAAALAVCGLLAALPGVAVAQQDEEEIESAKLETAIVGLAGEFVKYLTANAIEEVVVGPYTGPPGTSAGPRIVKLLKEQLAGKVEVVDSGACGISGKYRGSKTDEGRFAVVISTTICDELGAELQQLSTLVVTSEEEGLTFMGATAELPLEAVAAAGQSPDQALTEARADAVVEAVIDPAAAVSGGVVRSAPDSPYAIEILIKTPEGFQPLVAGDDRGVAQVDVGRDQVYAIKLINDSDEPAGVALTIDGINVLAFSENPSFREVGKWVIPPKSAGLIEGWHHVGPTFHSFLVTSYGESAAAKLGSVDNIGTITAVFTAAFQGNQPPADEPQSGALDRDQSATGLGPPVEREIKTMPVTFGVVRSAVSVRYTKPDLSDLPPE